MYTTPLLVLLADAGVCHSTSCVWYGLTQHSWT